MYSIKINNEIVAVADNILSAMNSVRKLVANKVDIRNENSIDFKTHGIEYLLWNDSATAVLSFNDELFTIFITKIAVV
jgi:hypothetical protein